MSDVAPEGIPDRLDDDAGAVTDTDLGGSDPDASLEGLTEGALDGADTELPDSTDETAGVAEDGTGEVASGDSR